jgi:hypothetical protein
VEEILAGIWQGLLRVQRVGRHDNFFEMGGHSLHGVKLTTTIAERFAVHLPVIAVFQYPTIHQTAEVIESLRLIGTEPLNSEGMQLDEGII